MNSMSYIAVRGYGLRVLKRDEGDEASTDKVNKLRYPRLILQTDLEVKPWRGIFLKGIQRYILERSSVRQWL